MTPAKHRLMMIPIVLAFLLFLCVSIACTIALAYFICEHWVLALWIVGFIACTSLINLSYKHAELYGWRWVPKGKPMASFDDDVHAYYYGEDEEDGPDEDRNS